MWRRIHTAGWRISSSGESHVWRRRLDSFSFSFQHSSDCIVLGASQRVEVQLKRHKEVARLAAMPAEEHAEEVSRMPLLSCSAQVQRTSPSLILTW